ncbi:hypothetical protein GOBAR_AA20828 [Gossypium barbadense]|uniref:Uncharacterized protein n=1 Tax=Gossypium barbadense TaxID=3634 RepID=A0A2P5X928_GOSBA|nr:hypothetical protein GOBAR_AA20828 [Gossypium barbadense]
MKERNQIEAHLHPSHFHVFHKLPPGDSPYVRAKHIQLVDKDPEGAIVLFWKAINAGDRVDSALKDMAVVMKQQDRAEEAIEAIKSFRDRCSKQAQESLDNVLIDLYKFYFLIQQIGERIVDTGTQTNQKCGRIEEQIQLLKQKLRMIYQGEAFNGKPTKTARSHGKKFQVTVKQETSRILGNLGWAYMQQENYLAAEVVYRKAQIIDPDANKACNLCQCLIKQARYIEAQSVLKEVIHGKLPGSGDPKSRNRVKELLQELESEQLISIASTAIGLNSEDTFLAEGIDQLMSQWTSYRSRRLPIFEEISSFRDQLAC